jgi:hypothetical protein
MRVPHLILPQLCVPTENVRGGGGEFEELFLLAHSCEERFSLQAAEVQTAQFCLGFSALMPHGTHSINCRMEKG